MGEVSTIGVDLAKNVFQVHGADVSGRGSVPQEGAATPASHLLCWPEALRSGHGGLAPLRSIFCRTGLNSSLTSHGPPREQRALC